MTRRPKYVEDIGNGRFHVAYEEIEVLDGGRAEARAKAAELGVKLLYIRPHRKGGGTMEAEFPPTLRIELDEPWR